jgi:hypothetical protein
MTTFIRRMLILFVAVGTFLIVVDGHELLAQTAPIVSQPTISQVVPPETGGTSGTGAGTIMENSIESTEMSEQSVQKMWDEIFSENSTMYQSVVLVATGFLGVFFLLTILPLLNDTGNFNWRGVGARFAWIALVAVLIGNDAQMLKGITIGTRGLLNETSSKIMDVQVDSMTMRDALNDVIISEKARAIIALNLADCEAKEGKEQITCFADGAEEAERQINIASTPQLGRPSPGLRRTVDRLTATIGEFRRAEAAAAEAAGGSSLFKLDGTVKGAISYVLQSTSQSASNELLKAIQQMFVYGLEISMLLTGLLGPLAVAASLLPTNPRAIYIWFIGFLTIGFIKLTYNILIAFCAIWVVTAERQGAGDFTALLLMSIASPAIAIALSSWGGISILNSIASSAGTAVSMVPVPYTR